MSYRSERFDVGELVSLGQTWAAVDRLALENGLHIVDEVMAGTSYRRQLHRDTQRLVGPINYLLQVTLQSSGQLSASPQSVRTYLDTANLHLSDLELPGTTWQDHGAVRGWNPDDTPKPPFGFEDANDGIQELYAPWVKNSWSEAGRSCLFYCGILPPGKSH